MNKKIKMNEEVRNAIRNAIRNKIDISDLIDKYDLSGENLSGAIITKLHRYFDKMNNVNFSNCVIGVEGSNDSILLNGASCKNCNFNNAKFLGEVQAKRTLFNNSSFYYTYMPYISAKFADFRGCEFCNSVFPLASEKVYGAKISIEVFEKLGKHWGFKVVEYNEIKEDSNNDCC